MTRMIKKVFAIFLTFTFLFLVVGCDGNKEKEVKKTVEITITEKNTVEVGAESFDYTEMFKITVDGENYPVTNEMIDASDVKLDEVGSYTVKLSASIVDRTVGDKEYETTYTKDATLNVVAKAATEKVVVISETSVSKEIENGDDTFDFTK